MSYPMTWRRFISRNRLQEGGYDDAGGHRLLVNVDHLGLTAEGEPDEVRWQEFYRDMGPDWKAGLRAYEGAFRSLLGDLRRLERDAVDEKAICDRIARRTGIDANVVAAVLQEFLDT